MPSFMAGRRRNYRPKTRIAWRESHNNHGESPTTTDGTFVLPEQNERPYVASIAARRFNDIESIDPAAPQEFR